MDLVYRKALNYLFFVFCFALPVSQLASSRLLILLVILSFVLTGQRLSLVAWLKQSWDLTLYYLVLVMGLLHTDEMAVGWRQLETNLCILGVPILLCNDKSFTKSSLQYFFYFFIAGLLLACFICLAMAFVNYSKTGEVSSFFYDQLTKPIDAQPTYFAYYLIFAITIALYQFYFELPKQYLGWACLVVTFFFLILLLTGGQTAFVSLLFVFSFFLSKYLVQRNTKRESIAIIMIIVGIIVMALWVTRDLITLDILPHTLKTDYWERMVLWKSALEATPNYFFGVGTGDYENVLNEYYRSHQLESFANNNLNAHNQYIQTLLSNGLIGLLVLLVMVIRPLYLATVSKDLLGVLLMYPFLLYGITEVFLGRYQGVVFFGFVHQALIAHYLPLPSREPNELDKLRTSIPQ